MTNKLDDLIGKSVKKPIQSNSNNSLADQLVKNADKALGIVDEEDKIKVGSVVKNLTFTFGLDEVKNIDVEVERFLKHGKNVSKSELLRIGLKLIEKTPGGELAALTSLITKHARGRQS